jgi:predicted metal-binding protein
MREREVSMLWHSEDTDSGVFGTCGDCVMTVIPRQIQNNSKQRQGHIHIAACLHQLQSKYALAIRAHLLLWLHL